MICTFFTSISFHYRSLASYFANPPSQLVGTGVAVATASTGLALGQEHPETNAQCSTPRSFSRRFDCFERFASPRRASTAAGHVPTLSILRPRTSASTAPELLDKSSARSSCHTTASSSFGQYPPNSSRSYQLAAVFNATQRPRSRRFSLSRGESVPALSESSRRDSTSSNGSWMQRFYSRPRSQYTNSRRSSICPDSLGFDMPLDTSNVPSVAPSADGLLSTPPLSSKSNLERRNDDVPSYSTLTVGRRGLMSGFASLRKSTKGNKGHNRSSTSEQLRVHLSSLQSEDASCDHIEANARRSLHDDAPQSRWRSIFQTKSAKLGSSHDTSCPPTTANSPNGVRRLLVGKPSRMGKSLLSPRVILPSPMATTPTTEKNGFLTPSSSRDSRNGGLASPTVESAPRKSGSMHFPSPTSWLPRTGSIRRKKRAESCDRDGAIRHVSAPLTGSNDAILAKRLPLDTTDRNKTRNCSAPLPAPPPLSSFNCDAKRDSSISAESRPSRLSGAMTQQQHSLSRNGAGRSSSRRPGAAHARSHSVPAAADPPENVKTPPKFGTWATGKPVCEDWDDDFDFGEDDNDAGGNSDKRTASGFSMTIPASIQVLQPTVKAHSGQIREFSMLVSKLKEDLRLARLEGLLNTHSALWKEAQGIIALASPEEDTSESASVSLMSDIEGVAKNDGNIDSELSADESAEPPVSKKTRQMVIRHKSAPNKRPDSASSDWLSAAKPWRRRSALLPEDDGSNIDSNDSGIGGGIGGVGGGVGGVGEGGGGVGADKTPTASPRTPVRRNDVARHVLESVHQQQLRAASDPAPGSGSKGQGTTADRLNFDSNSLKELVKRANEIHLRLSEMLSVPSPLPNGFLKPPPL